MKTVGLITEYNPFHNGHLYHIEKAKALTGADRVVVVMSGDFVQRGTPALLPKHQRAEMALLAGASVVIELPVCYATGSAEFFAQGAVSALHGLGCIDALCFGSECGDLTELTSISDLLAAEPESYQKILQKYLKSGLSFPAARCEALAELTGDSAVTAILSDPNNILGIEYLKALKRLDSPIVPVTVKRESSGYHDTNLGAVSSSATAIRSVLKEYSGSCHQAKPESENSQSALHTLLMGHLPDSASKILQDAWNHSCPVESNDFSLLLRYRLLTETTESLCRYQDVSKELANRIMKNRNQFRSFDQFCLLLKTRELTYSRISRSLLHILLSVTTEDPDTYRNTSCGYARVLGFRKEHCDILRAMKDNASIPVITKLSQTDALSPECLRLLRQTIFASDLYENVVSDKFDVPFTSEYQKQLVRI